MKSFYYQSKKYSLSSGHLVLMMLLFVLASTCYSQSTRFRYKVYIQKKHLVKKDLKIGVIDTVSVMRGSAIKSEKTITKGDVTYTITTNKAVKNDSDIYMPITSPVIFSLPGRAIISKDKDDSSRININYWLNASNEFHAGTKLKIADSKKTLELILKQDTSIYVNYISLKRYKKHIKDQATFVKLNKTLDSITKNNWNQQQARIDSVKELSCKITILKINIKQLAWFDYSNQKIFKIDRKGDTAGIYAKKYEDDYYLKLKNRQYASFWFDCVEGGALTIPFKYRPVLNKNGVHISDDFTADVNVGMYLGYSFGKINYMYRKNESKPPSSWLVSIGPFLSVSRVEVDSLNTLSAAEPLKTKRSIATISPGLGLMTSIYNFRFGVFLGNDLAIGSHAKKWDYGNKFWLGFGLGYNIGLLWGTGASK